ncbi:hypothetical protein G6O67_000561 [Ophiocordyceps sinensis]|uniref:Uncharacterized protein n=1 Tax=Ophiocordyceps sinensis TaxID=72228 RepID=A0A8H4PZG8_9HYPO|nr:hypothetical protein G6O67_000561 [Ophiocordyceps sinensis]
MSPSFHAVAGPRTNIALQGRHSTPYTHYLPRSQITAGESGPHRRGIHQVYGHGMEDLTWQVWMSAAHHVV